MSSTLLGNEVGMSFQMNENQQMIADMIRKFGKEHILPKMMEWDESQEFPVEVFKKLGELGLMGVLVPTEYGGSGFSYTEYVTAIPNWVVFADLLLYLWRRITVCARAIFYNLQTRSKRKNTFLN